MLIKVSKLSFDKIRYYFGFRIVINGGAGGTPTFHLSNLAFQISINTSVAKTRHLPKHM